MTNLYSFIRGSLELPFSEIFFSNASLWNQYKFVAFSTLSCKAFQVVFTAGNSHIKIISSHTVLFNEKVILWC